MSRIYDLLARVYDTPDHVDIASGFHAALRPIAAARPRDSLSLVHLIDRVPAGDRVAVWDRLVALAPVDATRRDAVLALDRSAIFAVFAQASSTWWATPIPDGSTNQPD